MSNFYLALGSGIVGGFVSATSILSYKYICDAVNTDKKPHFCGYLGYFRKDLPAKPAKLEEEAIERTLMVLMSSVTYPITVDYEQQCKITAPIVLISSDISHERINTDGKLFLTSKEIEVCIGIYNNNETVKYILEILTAMSYSKITKWFELDVIIFSKSGYPDIVIKLHDSSESRSVRISLNTFHSLTESLSS